MKTIISMCRVCKQQYHVEEEYGVNGSDEYSSKEIGHTADCLFYNMDPANKKYVTEEEIDSWKPFSVKKHMESMPVKDKRVRTVMYNDGTVSYREY